MSVQNNLEVVRSSAQVWGSGSGLRSLPIVSKLVDTSTCIGCKACEVACQEWNDLKSVATVNDGDYQTLKTLDAEFWNLIRFDEREVDGGIKWLMRKDQCMHCAEPGLPRGLPGPGRDRPVRERHRGREPRPVHRLRLLRDGLPVRRAALLGEDREDGQVHAVRGPRDRRPRARVHQGLPHRLPPLRDEGRHGRARQPARRGRSRRPATRRPPSTTRRASAAPAS